VIVVEEFMERELNMGAFASYLFQFKEWEVLWLLGGVCRSSGGWTGRGETPLY